MFCEAGGGALDGSQAKNFLPLAPSIFCLLDEKKWFYTFYLSGNLPPLSKHS